MIFLYVERQFSIVRHSLPTAHDLVIYFHIYHVVTSNMRGLG